VTARMSLVIPQGSTLRRRFDLKNPDGTAMDLTGYSARLFATLASSSTDVALCALRYCIRAE